VGRKGKLEDLVRGEAELVFFFGGEVRTHAHSESAIGRVGRVTANWANRIGRGGWVRVVRIIKSERLDVGGRGKERLIPRGIGDWRGEGVARDDLRHGKREEATLWRE
jgi:hypothetical protein